MECMHNVTKKTKKNEHHTHAHTYYENSYYSKTKQHKKKKQKNSNEHIKTIEYTYQIIA